MKTVNIYLADGRLLCRAEVADNPWSRGVGLLGRAALPDGYGLIIQPCNSVHTHFMRFPIDVLFIDETDRVIKISPMKLWRMAAGGRTAKKVLELPYGAADRFNLAPGEQLNIQPTPATSDRQ